METETEYQRFWSQVESPWSLPDLGVRTQCTPFPHGPKFSQFHAVFRKIWQIRMLAPSRRLAPLLRGTLDPPLIVVAFISLPQNFGNVVRTSDL